MRRRIFLFVPVALFLAVGGLFSGCDRDKGPGGDAQVDALRLSSELERTKKKLDAQTKGLAEKDDAILLAKAETEKAAKETEAKNAVIAEKDARIKTLEAELADMKKRDAFVFLEASKLVQQKLTSSALDRYRKFATDFPSSPLVTDASRAIAELSVTAPRDARARATAVAVDPKAVEREVLKRFADGFATPEDLAPLLKNKSMPEVIKILGPPNTTYRSGTELGYVDKVFEAAAGSHNTLVISFDEGKVATLRSGYAGRPVHP